MKKLVGILLLLLSVNAFSQGYVVEETFTVYRIGKPGENNWQELKYAKAGNIVKLLYNDEKQNKETPMIVLDFWDDNEENAVKMRVRFNASTKDIYLLKLYKNVDNEIATIEKIQGNFLHPYFRKLYKVKPTVF